MSNCPFSVFVSAPVLVASFMALNANAQTPAPSITDEGSIDGFNYSLLNQPSVYLRILRSSIIDENSLFSSFSFQYPKDQSITVNYYNEDGFKGIYSYEGKTGEIISDVSIDATFDSSENTSISGYIGLDRHIVIGGDNFGRIRFSGSISDNSRSFTVYSNSRNIKVDVFDTQFSGDGSKQNYPSRIAGEVQLKGFDGRSSGHQISDNALSGVFVANSERITTVEEEPGKEEPGKTVADNSRDTFIKHLLFRAEYDKYPGLEEDIDSLLEPNRDLKYRDGRYGLYRENPSSNIWYANPRINLPDNGKYELNIKSLNAGGKGWAKINEEDLMNHLNELELTRDEDNVSTNGIISDSLLWWATHLQREINRGYLQWTRHLDYDPGELKIGIKEFDDLSEAGHYDSAENKVFLAKQYLSNLYHDHVSRDFGPRSDALDRLFLVITHEAGHQFGYNNTKGSTEGCGGETCHALVGSGSVMSYDNEVDYGVTEEDIKHIPNATYNNNPKASFRITKDSPIGEYGVWLTHTFQVSAKRISDKLGFDGYLADNIETHGFIISNSDNRIPTVSATYSGTDNLIGVDMSAHYLGSLLRADAEMEYRVGSSTNSSATLTVDNFEVYVGDRWQTQSGSIGYELSCNTSACRTVDNKTVYNTRFYSNGEYINGAIQDLENEYAGSFVAERESAIDPYSRLIKVINRDKE